MRKKKSSMGLLCLVMLLVMSGFFLLSVSKGAFEWSAIVCGLVLTAILLAHYGINCLLCKQADKHLLMIAYVLVAIGMLMQYRINPQIAVKQLTWVGLGAVAYFVAMLLMRSLTPWRKFMLPLVLLSLLGLLLAVLLGKSTGGAYNWINLGGFSLQPSEFIKISLIFVLAFVLSTKNTVRKLLPLGCFVLACIVILFVSRDLGTAVIYAMCAIGMYYIATGNLAVTGVVLGLGVAGSVAGYTMFDHVRARVAAWQNPWASYQTNGYQIAQGLMAIASGGLFGMGLGRGTPKLIPAYHTDYIFAVICEEMGMIVGLIVIAMYFVFFARGMRIAQTACNSDAGLIAAGITIALATQTFLILGGIIKLIPLTGVTLPFVSYGGSSMMSCFLMLAVLQSICRINASEARQ